MTKSKIEWTDSTWNPIRADGVARADKTGWHCEHVSPGCENCYAEAMNRRLGTGFEFKPGHLKEDVVMFLDRKKLALPLSWTDRRMVFVCSMTDLFADFVRTEWLDEIFGMMALCRHHTFQVLTKRPERMAEYLNDPKTLARVCDQMLVLEELQPWPLPNVWCGISAENQEWYDKRILHLMKTPAAVRFVSAEPLLGPIDINGGRGFDKFSRPADACLDWVIVGGESGPRARPFCLGWAKEIVRYCTAADIRVFVKQIGRHPVNREGLPHAIRDGKGGDPAEWPPELRVREMPALAASVLGEV